MVITLYFTKSNYSKIYMEKGGQSIWNWKLWSFAFEIWDDIIDKYSVMTLNKEVQLEYGQHGKLYVFIDVRF